jgi:hypothetical protein
MKLALHGRPFGTVPTNPKRLDRDAATIARHREHG